MGGVCGFGRAITGEDLDDGIETDEGRPNAARMEGRKVGYIVEDAAEDEIIGTSVHGGCAEEEDSACNEDAKVGVGLGDEEVVVVPGAVFTEDKAGDEERGCPWEEKADAVRAVFYVVLPEVEDAGDKEEDGEEDGGPFNRSVDPERACDCGVASGLRFRQGGNRLPTYRCVPFWWSFDSS